MQISKAIVITLITLTCSITATFSQAINSRMIKTLQVADGLPQSFVSGLVQDKTGFIWIGTRDGLARYDGRKFKIFRHLPGNVKTVANNTISGLYLDLSNKLWIFYETGDVDIINTETEGLFHFTKDPLYKPVYNLIKTGHSIAEDAENNTWLLCNNGGIFICNQVKRTIHFYADTAMGLQNNKIVGITAMKGHVVLVTDSALVIMNGSGKIEEAIPYTFTHPHLYNATMKWKDAAPFVRKNGDIIFLDDERLIIYSPGKKYFSTVPVDNSLELLNFCIAEDDKGNVFFDAAGNISVLSPKNEMSVWKAKEKMSVFRLKSMLIDRSGILWLGSTGAGLRLFDLRLSRLTGLLYEKNFQEDILQKYLGVPAAEIKKTFLYNMYPYRLRWLKENNGKIWFSRAVNNPVDKPPLCYYKDGHLIQPLWHYTDTLSSKHFNINALALSRSGKLWGVDFFLRPVYFDTLTYAVTVYPSIASIDFDYTFTANSMLIDGEDKFWISTALNGLYCFEKQKGLTTHYYYNEKPGSLPTNQLMNLVQDPTEANIMWIGSLGGGLIKFNKATGKCKAYTTDEGLPNNTVYSVTLDAKGKLWCSSNKGIFSFVPLTGAVRSFTSKDGLLSDEFNRYHYLQFPDERICFGGVDGYTVFNPASIAEDIFQPAVALTAIGINNKPADFGYPASPFKSAVNSLERIELPYYKNFLTFEFAALQYNIPEKLQYRYLLENFDNDWVNAGNDNIATYTNVSPGKYILKINATNTAGEWSSYIKTLTIIIRPPFWKTWWFITLEISSVAALIYFLIQYRIAEVRKEEQQKAEFEREASELKAEALRAQMNPHFIFNCLNSIKALIQEDNKQQAVIYLTTFSKLIRNQLNNAQREISLYQELETCKLYTQLEALRFGTKIICEFKIEEGVDTHSLQVPPLILQPFIENAIWHGILPKGIGHVNISVTEKDEHILCSIEDDGIGRQISLQNKSLISSTYQSKGLKLVQGRLSLHNIINNRGGTVEIIDKKDEKNNPSGTLVIVTFKKEA